MARVVWKKNPEYRGKGKPETSTQPAPAPEKPKARRAPEPDASPDPRFSEDYLSSLRELDPSLESRPQVLARARELEALRVLGGDTEYDWLTRKDDPSEIGWKRKLLSELGKFDDTAEMSAVARELCLIQPTPEDAIALVSRFLRGESRAASPDRRSKSDPPYVAAEYVKQELADDAGDEAEEESSQPEAAAEPHEDAPSWKDLPEDFPPRSENAVDMPPVPDDEQPHPEPQSKETSRPDPEPDRTSEFRSEHLLPVPSAGSGVLSNPQEAQLAREITDAMNRAIVDFGMRHDLNPQQVRRALMHSALEVLRNCIE